MESVWATDHHGLEQDFNSLDAQYDAAQAYIRSQAHILIQDEYRTRKID
jgi:hypothetical protein